MRDASLAIIREIGVETGGSNIQFGVNPADGRMVVIEMNPRVSRSSALASKATGFPIAKIAAKLAVGFTLDELRNDITRETPASFEPAIDYCVVKFPRWAFEVPRADQTLTTQMKSVGEAMASGGPSRKRSESRPVARAGPLGTRDGQVADGRRGLRQKIRVPTPSAASRWRGATVGDVHPGLKPLGDRPLVPRTSARSSIEREISAAGPATEKCCGRPNRWASRTGGSLKLCQTTEAGSQPRACETASATFKMVDTCAAGSSRTPYLYSTYEEDEAPATAGRRSSSSAPAPTASARASSSTTRACTRPRAQGGGRRGDHGQHNPETVSTDYDTSDRLFQPLTRGRDERRGARRPRASSSSSAGRRRSSCRGARGGCGADPRHTAGRDRPRRTASARRPAHRPGAPASAGRDRARSTTKPSASPRHRLPGFGPTLLRAGRASHADHLGREDLSTCRKPCGATARSSWTSSSGRRRVDVDAIADAERVVVGGVMGTSRRPGSTRATRRAPCRPIRSATTRSSASRPRPGRSPGSSA